MRNRRLTEEALTAKLRREAERRESEIERGAEEPRRGLKGLGTEARVLRLDEEDDEEGARELGFRDKRAVEAAEQAM